jgi:hypothetical protein
VKLVSQFLELKSPKMVRNSAPSTEFDPRFKIVANTRLKYFHSQEIYVTVKEVSAEFPIKMPLFAYR